MSDFRAHSFDAPRERPAPAVLKGRTNGGDDAVVQLRGPTLVVAIKPDCDGCRDFVDGELVEFEGVPVVLVSATNGNDEWQHARRVVLVAPELLDELEIRSAPFYVLIDPENRRVLCEGSLFSAAQVASEIASSLSH